MRHLLSSKIFTSFPGNIRFSLARTHINCLFLLLRPLQVVSLASTYFTARTLSTNKVLSCKSALFSGNKKLSSVSGTYPMWFSHACVLISLILTKLQQQGRIGVCIFTLHKPCEAFITTWLSWAFFLFYMTTFLIHI